jgi:hypothetical protein
MAVLQRVSFEPNERLDTPDARALEAFSLNDWRFFLSGFLSPQSYVLAGFEIANYATIFTVPGFQLTLSDVVLFHSEATTQAAGFYVFAGTEQNASVSLSPSATNYVEATLTDASGTPDVRAFWDESANGGQGGEFTDTINTVINLDLQVTSNITGFTNGKIPLFKVVTNSSGIVTSVEDCRNLFFRLGTGGNSPNPGNSFSYPSLPDSAHARMETPNTSTSATVSNAPFQGGDKNIKTFKQWMDAVMSSIKEIKQTPYWYSQFLGGSGLVSTYQNSALTILDGGVWQQNPPFLSTTGSVINGSNQLTGLASTAGIVGGNVQIVTGADIPNSPATTVVSIVGNTVTMSANAIGTNASEAVQFSRAAPGQLQLTGTSHIHRLGFSNNLVLGTFLFDLAIEPDLWVLLPIADVSLSYSAGQDGSNPIVPQQITNVSTTTISVNTGGNYITGPGNIMVRGQSFSYTGYTPGTGLFSGVSPDPSGLAQNNDYVYQLDLGGTGYYHYSQKSVVPNVINGVSMGAERVFWLAHFNTPTITLRFGQVLPGEIISEPSSSITNILLYIGSPSPATSSPQYTVTATGALTGQTNYNSVAAEDLTSRLSRITTMMADKAQDKTIGLLASGYSAIVNTTSGGNQQITFTGGGTMTVAMPGSANNGSIGLGNTLTLATLQAAYFSVFRNAPFTISDLSGLTVANITAVPIDENTRIFAYRLSDNNVYLWNGSILPVGTTLTPAQLATDVEQNLNSKLINGGTWAWNSGSSTLSWSATANIAIPGLADSVNQIVAGSTTLNDGDVAWVNVNRTGPGGSLTVFTGPESSVSLSDQLWIIARRTGTNVLVGHSFLLVNGESKPLDAGVSVQNLAYIGAPTEASSSPSYSSQTFITNGDSLTTAAGELDARALVQQTVVNQQRNALLFGGGTWSWNAGTGVLAWNAAANIAIGGLADSVNLIATGNVTLTNGQVAYVEVNRVGPGGTLTVNVALESALVLDDNTVIIARRTGSLLDVGYPAKMLLQDGESKELGSGLSSQNRTYLGITTEATSSPAWNSGHSAPLRTIPANTTDVTSAVASIDTEIDKFFGQFRIKPHPTLVNRVIITGVDFTMLDTSILSQTMSNLIVSFTGSQIDFATGTVYQSDGVSALGINFTPFSIPVGQYFWYSINVVASTVGADNRISVQMLVLPAASANAVAGSAPLAAFTSTGKNIGQVLFQNVSGTITLNTIRQLGVGSGSGGGGVGDVTDIQSRMQIKLSDSRYELATVADFKTDTTSLTSSATASYDTANTRYKFTAVAQNIVSINLFDTNEFLTQGVDCGEVEVDLFYLLGDVDKTPTVEISRDGGNNYYTVSMARLGTTDEFNGRVLITTDEASFATLHTYAFANADTTLDLTGSSNGQARSQVFTVSSTEVLKTLQFQLNKTGSPTGSITLQIIKDNGSGAPSLLVQDIVAATAPIQASSIASGTNSFTFNLTQALPPATYHMVLVTDATYKASYSAGVTSLGVRADGSSPGVPVSNQYNGTSWAATTAAFVYIVTGRVMDLRLRITSSATTNWDDPTQAILRGFAVSYNPTISNITTGIDALEIQQVNGNSNTSTFTLTKFLPDWRFLRVYVNETGQVFKCGAFSLNGFQVVFPANSFSTPNQLYTLTFDQLVGGGFDNSDSNAAIIAANHLGSTDATIDRSIAGRGIVLRRPDGTLREVSLDNSDNIVISSTP